MSKLSTLIYQSDAKSRFILAGAASAVAFRKRAMAGQARVFASLSRCCGEAYFKYVAPPNNGGTGARKPAENAAHRENSHLWMETT